MAQVRYIVNDVESSIEFYVSKLGFKLDQQFGPAMAILIHEDLRLWIAGPQASASKPMSNGEIPSAGGWNRIVVVVDDLDTLVSDLRESGVSFRNEVVTGPGGRQILCEDPSGNPIELFQTG